jgi:hypothetical protein
MIAAKRGNKQIVEALLTFGAQVDETDFLHRDANELSDKYLK